MLFDGTSVTQLTDNDYNDYYAKIDGDYISWVATEDSSTQIYLATFGGGEESLVPEPTSLILFGLGILALIRKRIMK